jgi:hypothetical protein
MVFNLLSQDIIDDNGKPGRNFALALQKTADPKGAHSLNPMRTGKYSKLPQPNTTYAYRSAPQCTGRAWRWYEPDVRLLRHLRSVDRLHEHYDRAPQE